VLSQAVELPDILPEAINPRVVAVGQVFASDAKAMGVPKGAGPIERLDHLGEHIWVAFAADSSKLDDLDLITEAYGDLGDEHGCRFAYLHKGDPVRGLQVARVD